MASKPSRVLDRLAGLETEYGIRFHPRSKDLPPPTKFQLYQAVVDRLKQSVLTVSAKHFKEGIFCATGGAVWFESERPCSGAGLVEGSTPECRGARQLLAYQRAQDQLLSEAAIAADVAGEVRLIKNDQDSQGNVYGAQENYEASIATGWRLLAWRTGLILLLPMALTAWIGLGAMVVLTLIYYLFAAIFLFLAPQRWKENAKFVRTLLGDDWFTGVTTGNPSPRWLENVLLIAARAVTLPFAAAFYVLARWVLFRQTRDQLLPFLITRPIFGGCGHVALDNTFQLSDKASAINCVTGYGGVLWDRPLFNFGHFFKAICVEVPFSPLDLVDLFSARQRLQIGLGDSNMAEVAEFLRIGTTLLVLDVIEAGELPRVPQVASPIRTLHQVCRDPSLTGRMTLKKGNSSPLEMQRFYLEACRVFLARRPDASAEAHEIFDLWETTLDRLEADPESLVGSLDWVTKKFLLDGMEEPIDWKSRKKLDIRYHELSPEGYFNRLRHAGVTTSVLTPEEIERASRLAPHDSPATTRGHYIREFAHGADGIMVNWKAVVLGRGRSAKVIRLSEYGRRQVSEKSDPGPSHEIEDNRQ